MIRVAVAAICALVLALLATVGAGAAPNVGGCTVFPDFNGSATAKSAANQTAWNQDITKAPVHKRSKEIVRKINSIGGSELHPDFGGGGEYGIPFETVGASQPDVEVSIGPDGYPDESDFGPAPIPADARIEGGASSDGDRHVLVVDTGSCGLYELYRAFPRSGGAWQADATAFFDLTKAAPLRPAGFTSTDAAGLAVFAGLVRFDEVAAGRVEHAIRMTFDETRAGYIPPATHLASDSCDRDLPPMGMRLRMKGNYFKQHLKDYPEGSQSRPIFEAFRHYGTINADNGSNWYFQGSVDTRWDDENLNRLKEIPGSAFQVVKSAAKQTSRC